MPSPEDLKRISGAISSDPAAFLPQLLAYIEKSVKECYDKNNEASHVRPRFRTLTIA